MFSTLAIAFALMAVSVAIHAAGLIGALRWFAGRARLRGTFWPSTGLLIAIAGWVILVHLVEITIWGLFYWWKQCMPDVQSALYFSAVTYTTTGYGDLVLPGEWRLVGGVEALTGILMCGWSTAFFLAVVGRMFEGRAQ